MLGVSCSPRRNWQPLPIQAWIQKTRFGPCRAPMFPATSQRTSEDWRAVWSAQNKGCFARQFLQQNNHALSNCNQAISRYARFPNLFYILSCRDNEDELQDLSVKLVKGIWGHPAGTFAAFNHSQIGLWGHVSYLGYNCKTHCQHLGLPGSTIQPDISREQRGVPDSNDFRSVSLRIPTKVVFW